MILVDYRDLADIAASGQYRPADRERREKGSSTSNVVSGDPGAVLSGAEQVRHDRDQIQLRSERPHENGNVDPDDRVMPRDCIGQRT